MSKISDFDFTNSHSEKYQTIFIPVFDKNRKQNVVLEIHLFSNYYFPTDGSKQYFLEPSIFNLQGIVQIYDVQSPIKNDQKEQIKKIFSSYNHRDDYYSCTALVSLEYMKNGLVQNHIQNYITSKGAQHDLINPTVRSKIIYGVAVIMNRLHNHNILHQLPIDHIYLDDNLEPKIKLSSHSFKIHEILEIFIDDCMLPEDIFSPEIITKNKVSFPSDVFKYAFFLYGMFTGLFGYKNAIKSRHYFDIIKYLKSGKRPKLSKEIPEPYIELIEKCWHQNPDERPTFEQIVEMLKYDKYAINEFGMKTDLDELHRYQEKINNDK